jgi:hypothetical protein
MRRLLIPLFAAFGLTGFQPGYALPMDSVSVSRPDENLQSVEYGNFPKSPLPKLRYLNVSGYYRFVTNYRHLSLAYPHLAATPNNIFVGDDSQIPQLSLNINGSAGKHTSFGTDLYLWTPMTGMGESENVKGLNLGVSLYGSYATDVGEFKVTTGGINWYALSPFTFQTNKGYDRYSIFERNPWDPNTFTLAERYDRFYGSGAIDQDQRWGQQAFQGLILEGNKMPAGFSGVFMYGKTQLNGGLSPLPNTSYGGKIRKVVGDDEIAVNTFNNISYSDSLQEEVVGFHVVTGEFRVKSDRFLLKGEVGAGQVFDQRNSGKWGELISVKGSTSLFDRIPAELHLFRLSPDAVNNSAAFINTTVVQASGDSYSPGTQPVLPAVASAMVPIGQLVNNRTGAEVNAQINLGPVKTSVGYHVSRELESRSSALTYGHPINGLALAHFWRWNFPSNVGPYGNLTKIYRAVYETVDITAVDSLTGFPAERKCFNSVELNMKYSCRVFGQPMYLFYLGQYSSAQFKPSWMTVFTEEALLRTYYHQLESYWSISPSLVLCNYVGVERIIANYDTRTDVVTLRPRNQTGWGLATGLDIRLSKNAGAYLRQRWMNYKDTSFRDDRYRGYETTVEIKIFF